MAVYNLAVDSKISSEIKEFQAERVVDIRALGAVGDGVTDNTALLTQAIAEALPGTMFVIPRGTYLTKAPLMGENKTRIMVYGTGGVIKFDRNTYNADKTGYALRFKSSSDITIMGVQIDDGDVHIPRDNKFAGRAGIHLHTVDNYKLLFNRVYDSSGYGIQCFSTSRGVVSGNIIENTEGDGIQHVNNCREITITGNNVHNTGDDCISLISHSYDGYSTCHSVTISGNQVGLGKSHGINTAGSERVTIVGNSVTNTYAAAINASHTAVYNIDQLNHINIVGNIVCESGQNSGHTTSEAIMGAINVASGEVGGATAVHIADNVIQDSRYFAIAVTSAAGANTTTRVVIENNLMDGSGRDCMSIVETTNVTVRNNLVMSSDGHGLYMRAIYGTVAITGNEMESCGLATPGTSNIARGIFLDGQQSDSALVSGNIVRDNGSPRTTTQDIEIIRCPGLTAYGNTTSKPMRIDSACEKRPTDNPTGVVVGSSTTAASAPGGAVLTLAINDSPPATAPTNGGCLYVEGNELRFLSPGNQVFVLTPEGA